VAITGIFYNYANRAKEISSVSSSVLQYTFLRKVSPISKSALHQRWDECRGSAAHQPMCRSVADPPFSNGRRTHARRVFGIDWEKCHIARLDPESSSAEDKRHRRICVTRDRPSVGRVVELRARNEGMDHVDILSLGAHVVASNQGGKIADLFRCYKERLKRKRIVSLGKGTCGMTDCSGVEYAASAD
jgi:hypothetical protein